jgi:DNA-binding transcriptional MerR regulator
MSHTIGGVALVVSVESMDGTVQSRLRSRVKGCVVKIGEVARQAGVSVDTVRYYERRGVLPVPRRQPSGYRSYDGGIVERLRLARVLQGLGLTLDEIIDALRAHDRGDATCESERWRLTTVLDRIDAKMAELEGVRGEVDRVLAGCDGGDCVFSSRESGAVSVVGGG